MGESQRRRLVNRRPADTFELIHDSIIYSVSIGFYDDGEPGELFLSAGKSGTQLDVATRDSAVAVSLAMQYGCPPDVIAKACLRNEDSSPAGILGAALDRILADEE